MPLKERETLFKINEAMTKIFQGPQTTNTPMTGEVEQPPVYQPSTQTLPLNLPPQTQR